MIVFGGALGASSPCANDVWVLANANGINGTPTWIQLSPSGSAPAPRWVSSAVYDPGSNRMTVFGGNSCFSPFYNDVWVLANANGLGGTAAWTQLSPTGTPPDPSGYHTAVYDPSSNRMIVFGVLSGGTYSNQVWVLTNANGLGGTPAWIQLTTAGPAIPARLNHGAVYDANSNRMTIFGGGGSVDFNDAWVLANANGLNGTPTWSQLSPSGPLPPVREGLASVYNPPANTMVIFGGQTGASTYFNDAWVLTSANGILDDDSQYSQINGGNSFTGNQSVNGNVTATNFIGNGSGLTGVAAVTANTANFANAANTANTAGFATNAGIAANALALGGISFNNYARLDVGNNFTGNQFVLGDLSIAGNFHDSASATVGGSLTIGGGTAITEHLSATYSVSLPVIFPLSCAKLPAVALPGASDGDTVALGVKNALTHGGILTFFAWVSSANEITMKACNSQIGPVSTPITGTIRVDVWKH